MPQGKGCTREFSRHWGEANDQLVARGEAVFALGHLIGWEQELQLANRDRRGRPLPYPDMVIEFFCELLIALGRGFRFAEGAGRALLGMVGIPCPDYTTIFCRCQKLDLEEMGRKAVKDMLAMCPAVTCVSADSSGLSTSVRGEWLGYRYHLKRKFLKVHVVVDTHNCFPISWKVTNGNRGDAPLLPFLIRRMRLLVKSIRDLLAAAYDSRKNFDLLHGLKIEPIINVRRGASMKTKGGTFARAKVVAELHRIGLKDWKKVKD